MIAALLPGALIGVALGMMSFAKINPDMLRVAIGVMAIGFVVRYAWQRRKPEAFKANAKWGTVLVASAVSGFAGFVAHAGGPPIKGTLLKMGLDKSAFVGTNAVFFFTLNLAKGLGYAALGLFSPGTLVASLSLAPFLFLGVGLGFALHNRIPQKTFGVLAHALLAIAGVNLLFIGLASLEMRPG